MTWLYGALPSPALPGWREALHKSWWHSRGQEGGRVGGGGRSLEWGFGCEGHSPRRSGQGNSAQNSNGGRVQRVAECQRRKLICTGG